MTGYVQVVTTLDSYEAAQRLAEHLVRERLAACVQIVGPITSVYRWQGKVETAQEWQCLAKTRDNLFHRLEAAVRSQHTYQVPEILALPIWAGNADYLAWLDGELLPNQA